MGPTETFRAARDVLLSPREDGDPVRGDFHWPELAHFNFGFDFVLAAGHAPDAATAESILLYCRDHLAPYKRVRRIEFAELPKTISGRIRRVELRTAEQGRDQRSGTEFREEDFPGLKG